MHVILNTPSPWLILFSRKAIKFLYSLIYSKLRKLELYNISFKRILVSYKLHLNVLIKHGTSSKNAKQPSQKN